MDWKTILASGVVAAIVAGIFELWKQKSSNTARYVIEQRELWRDKIRKIADEIYSSNKENVGDILVDLKTRINPYGRFDEFVYIESHQRKGLKRKEKKQLTEKENKQEEYYLKDSHIWRIIDKLEKNLEFEKSKSIIIEYLSALVKFDWERTKLESSINKKMLISIFAEIFSLLLMVFNFGEITSSNIIVLIVFSIIYALPISSAVLLSSQTVLIKKNHFRMTLKIFLWVIIFFGIMDIIAGLTDNVILIWSSVFSLIASMFIMSATEERARVIEEYICFLEKIDC